MKVLKYISRVSSRGGTVILALLAGLLLPACDRSREPEPDDIFIRSREAFADRPGARVGPLVVQVLGQVIEGVPGRNGYRDPVPGVEVTFEVKGWASKVAAQALPAEGESPAAPDGKELLLPRSGVRSPPKFLSARAGPQEITVVENGTGGEDPAAIVKTDADGHARVDLELGLFVGNFRVRAEIRDWEKKKRAVEFLVVSGIEVISKEREAPPGGSLDVTVQVWKVTDEREAGNGTALAPDRGDDEDEEETDVDRPGLPVAPDPDRWVYFTALESSRESGSASLDKMRDRTNQQGSATAKLTLGNRSGVYHVLAELRPEESPLINRGVVFEHYALSRWELGLYVLGGVALFVVGLRLLGNGLIIRLSPFLPLVTGSMSRNRAVGFLGGTAVGAAFQSSSAVLSHLVSLANGGILLAAGAMALLLGANLGKTLLLQLLAFDSMVLLAVPLIAAGTILLLLPGRVGSRPWASILLGGGFTLLGWRFLGEAAGLLEFSPSLREAVAAWDPGAGSRTFLSTLLVFASNALLALLVAFLLRNANLAVAGVMAFAARGLVSPQTAVPVILGASVGASLFVFVASLTRNREARHLALGQTLVQALGGLWLIPATLVTAGGIPVMLHLTDGLMPGHLFHPQPENTTHHIAMLYTLYHLVNGALFLGLSPWILKLAGRIIPRDPVHDDIKPYRLDPNLVDVPSLALAQAAREVGYLGELVRKSVAESFDAFRYQDCHLTDQIARREETINGVHGELSRYLLRIAENSLAPRDAVHLECLHVAAGNFSRTGEIGDQLSHLTTRLLEEKLQLPEDIVRELTDLYELVINQFENVLHLLENPDPRVEENAMKIGERVARSSSRFESLWNSRARTPSSAGETPVNSEETLLLLSRQAYDALAFAAAHLTHIAARIRILSAR